MKRSDMLNADAFHAKLKSLDGQGYHLYAELSDLSVAYPDYSLIFRHIQGSGGASPASLCQVVARGRTKLTGCKYALNNRVGRLGWDQANRL